MFQLCYSKDIEHNEEIKATGCNPSTAKDLGEKGRTYHHFVRVAEDFLLRAMRIHLF